MGFVKNYSEPALEEVAKFSALDPSTRQVHREQLRRCMVPCFVTRAVQNNCYNIQRHSLAFLHSKVGSIVWLSEFNRFKSEKYRRQPYKGGLNCENEIDRDEESRSDDLDEYETPARERPARSRTKYMEAVQQSKKHAIDGGRAAVYVVYTATNTPSFVNCFHAETFQSKCMHSVSARYLKCMQLELHRFEPGIMYQKSKSFQKLHTVFCTNVSIVVFIASRYNLACSFHFPAILWNGYRTCIWRRDLVH